MISQFKASFKQSQSWTSWSVVQCWHDAATVLLPDIIPEALDSCRLLSPLLGFACVPSLSSLLTVLHPLLVLFCVGKSLRTVTPGSYSNGDTWCDAP